MSLERKAGKNRADKPGADSPERERRIAAVGVTDEETAHLRLLMRRAGDDLVHTWKWAGEETADLLVVDPSSFAGQMARTRAQSAGMRCAVFSDEEQPGTDFVLQRPLKLANVIAVLNGAGEKPARSETIVPDRPDFYFRDVGEQRSVTATGEHAAIVDAAPPKDVVARGLEELFKVDPSAEKDALRIKTAPEEAAVYAPSSGPTARAEARARGGIDARGNERDASKDLPPPKKVRIDYSKHGLREILDSELLLGGPARIVLGDAPPLALDPKQKMFHTARPLSELAPYFSEPLRMSEWQPLTTGDLAELRVTEPAQPYLKLIWLDTLLHSGGTLARHLDPGGTYRLVRWIEIERDFSSYFRIASSMLQPARLHEIAATSGASMSDVFDVVNAYDAVGLIEWTPRARRSDQPEKPVGLFDKLRSSFRKP